MVTFFLFLLWFFGSTKWLPLCQGRISQREGWLLFIAPLQLHMRSAGEVPHGQVSSHASSYCFLLSSGPCGLMRSWEPERLMALFEGRILCIKMGGLFACVFSNPFIKRCISGDAKVSWNFIQVPGDWLRNDGQGGTSGMLKCSVLPLQAPSHKPCNFHL